ncbi:terminase [Desulfovibrio desulfuricans]|nr:terminase [Desulfovibrio desulfuricans]
MTDNAPYQRGIMDAITDPNVERVVAMCSAQVGKSEIILNAIGRFIDVDPCPILWVLPTIEMAQTFSKDRLAPMLRDTPSLRNRVGDPRAKDSDCTILHKRFTGGHLTLCGANSPASLASRPVRVVLKDEVDRFPTSAGEEGDPCKLADKRATTFWNRKIIEVSTPTVKGASRIEQSFMESDQRRYFVPCPHCKTMQTLKWSGVLWPEGKPELATYTCETCGAEIEDAEKMEMMRRGEWRATAQGIPGVAGFHINELYSPWVTWGRMAQDFLEAKKLPETLQTWVNTALGETWEEQGEGADEGALSSRVESYGPDIPQGVGVLTAGVDVQDDRIECEVVGWGKDWESWSIDYTVLHGDPARPELWTQLDDHLSRLFDHEYGGQLRIASACIDTGGHHSQRVYDFCRPRFARRIYAIKGSSHSDAPVIGKPSRNNKGNVHLFTIGVHALKDLCFGRLRVPEPGPGYCHFPAGRDHAYFEQMTAEHCITRFVKGFPKREWVKKSNGARNEAWDCRVYATAACIMLNPQMDKLLARLRREPSSSAPAANPAPVQAQPEATTRPAQPQRQTINRPRRSGGFVGGWR